MSALINPIANMGFNYLLGSLAGHPQASNPYGSLDRSIDPNRPVDPSVFNRSPIIQNVEPYDTSKWPSQAPRPTSLDPIQVQGKDVPLPPPRPPNLGGPAAPGTAGASASGAAGTGMTPPTPSASPNVATSTPGANQASPMSNDPIMAILGMLGLTSLLGGSSDSKGGTGVNGYFGQGTSTVGKSPFDGADPMSFINQLFGGGSASGGKSSGGGSPMDLIGQLFGGK